MGLLDKLWDDVMAGPVPHPDQGLGKLRKINTLNIKGLPLIHLLNSLRVFIF